MVWITPDGKKLEGHDDQQPSDPEDLEEVSPHRRNRKYVSKAARPQVCAYCKSFIKTPVTSRVYYCKDIFCSEKCEERSFREYGYAKCVAEKKGLLDQLQEFKTKYFDGITVF